jgi:hypothetical protein
MASKQSIIIILLFLLQATLYLLHEEYETVQYIEHIFVCKVLYE